VASVPFAFNGVVRLTSIGAAHVLLTLVLGFAAINTGNNSLYLALAFLLGSLLISGIASKGGLRHIRIEIVHIDEAWTGRSSRGILRVMNDSSLWNVRDIVVTMPELEQPVLVAVLRRRSSLDVPVTFLFERRGKINFRIAELYTRYPFGFFLKKRRTPLAGEVIVFPRLLTQSAQRTAFSPDHGETLGSNRAGSGTDIFTFREYVRGDSLRHIHWKKSASLGRWIMKQSEQEWIPAIRVFVDPVKPAWASDEDFENLISEATTFLHAALESKESVTLLLPEVAVSGDGTVGRRSIFEALALVAPATSTRNWGLRDSGEIVFSLRKHESQVA
jgi:uncharacterized protein (DUF58 family)